MPEFAQSMAILLSLKKPEKVAGWEHSRLENLSGIARLTDAFTNHSVFLTTVFRDCLDVATPSLADLG